MGHWRFFISYATKDDGLWQAAKKSLEGQGHHVLGVPTARLIRRTIQHDIERAHIFLPLLTRQAAGRPWVHEEIGYAIACRSLIVPVIIGTEMYRWPMVPRINAITARDAKELKNELGGVDWDALVANGLEDDREEYNAVRRCEPDPGSRSQLMADCAQRIDRHCRTPCCRPRIKQRGGLSSFSLPREAQDPLWQGLDPTGLAWFKPRERKALEVLMLRGGCDLVVDPCFFPPNGDRLVQQARLKTLAEFLRTNPKDVRVASKKLDATATETIIGDHWMAQSSPGLPGMTSRQTISTWHPHTVRRHAEAFDEDFNRLKASDRRIASVRRQLDCAISVVARGKPRPKKCPAGFDKCRIPR